MIDRGNSWTSLVSAHLMSKALTAFCPTVPFQECLYSKHPWKMQCFFPEQKAGMVTSHPKRPGLCKLKAPPLGCG